MVLTVLLPMSKRNFMLKWSYVVVHELHTQKGHNCEDISYYCGSVDMVRF